LYQPAGDRLTAIRWPLIQRMAFLAECSGYEFRGRKPDAIRWLWD